MPDPTRPQKGILGNSGLPAAGSYPRLQGRNRLLALGAGASALVLVALGIGLWSSGGHLASAGPLSSSHAGLEGDCGTCHEPFQPVADGKCRTCHEPRAHASEAETRICAGCHREHQGRKASPVSRADEHCVSCHELAPFGTAHPEFRSAALEAESRFPHPVHLSTLDTDFGLRDPEEACRVCHHRDRSGTGIPAGDLPLCGDCHEEGAWDAVEGPQRWAAAFVHESHEIQLSCLDCHDGVREGGGKSFPGLDGCRRCHDGDRAPDGCTHCHRYHDPRGEE